MASSRFSREPQNLFGRHAHHGRGDLHFSSSARPTVASLTGQPKGVAADAQGSVFIATEGDVQIIKDGKKIFSLPVNFQASAIAASSKGLVAVGGQVRATPNGVLFDLARSLKINLPYGIAGQENIRVQDDWFDPRPRGDHLGKSAADKRSLVLAGRIVVGRG